MRGAAVVCAVWLVTSLASAQAASTDEEAHLRFEAGQLAFRDGRYEDALADFRRSYELSHRAELLYNIGQCADRLQRDRDAVDAFDAYLREAGEGAAYRREVEARVALLDAALSRGSTAAPPTEAEEPVVAAEPEPEPQPMPASEPARVTTSGDPTGGIVVASAGAAILAAGIVTLVFGEIDRDHVEHPAPGSAWSDISDAAGRVPVLEGVGVAAIAVGAIACGVGIVWAVASGETHTEVRATASGLSIMGTF